LFSNLFTQLWLFLLQYLNSLPEKNHLNEQQDCLWFAHFVRYFLHV